MANKLYSYTVTRNPSDFPGRYVCRRNVIQAGAVSSGPVLIIADSFDEIVSQMRFYIERESLVWFDAGPGDDPVVVGCWI